MAYSVALLSLGCKVNSYETEHIRENMVKSGFIIVDFSEKADVYIINTCSVTNIADRKSRQMLHRARSLNPDAIVVATGCYVQTEKDVEKLKDVANIIIGNNHKGEIAKQVLELIDNRLNEQRTIDVQENDDFGELLDDIAMEKSIEELSISDYPERSRAFVRIEDGCNQFCSYCIIPYARGRVRSRDENDILEEVGMLASKGFKEVVLTGIHISSYGYENYEKMMRSASDQASNTEKDTEIKFDSAPLLHLVKRISLVKGVERIRLGSLEPRIITREFAAALKEIPSFCPHFHLSLQSGCDTVLKRMNRHYSAEEFLEKCSILREVFDRPAITTDVIVGFPGETDEEFDATLKMVQKASFAKMHIFKFSRRKGTVADRMPQQLTEKEKHARSIVIQKLDDEMKQSYATGFVGEEVKILVEEKENGRIIGLTERYVQVIAEPKDLNTVKENELWNEINVNDMVSLKVTKAENGILFGKL